MNKTYSAREVAWYRMNGRFPQRIKRDSRGREYVIGDISWNRGIKSNIKCPHCGKSLSESFEKIEKKMEKDLKTNEYL